MPIYEYKCENGHLFDAMQRMADDPLTECQECGAPVVRVLHSPAVHFKGSGFYNTDYGKQKGGGTGSSGDGAKESKSSSSSSDSGSSDSKSSDSKSSGDSKPAASTAD